MGWVYRDRLVSTLLLVSLHDDDDDDDENSDNHSDQLHNPKEYVYWISNDMSSIWIYTYIKKKKICICM